MEAVVIYHKDKVDARTKHILDSLHKTQEFSERVFVIEEDKKTIESIKHLPGVIILNHITEKIRNMLSNIEVISLYAWKSKKGAKKKDRIGDGLSWGHENFKAPR